MKTGCGEHVKTSGPSGLKRGFLKKSESSDLVEVGNFIGARIESLSSGGGRIPIPTPVFSEGRKSLKTAYGDTAARVSKKLRRRKRVNQTALVRRDDLRSLLLEESSEDKRGWSEVEVLRQRGGYTRADQDSLNPAMLERSRMPLDE